AHDLRLSGAGVCLQVVTGGWHRRRCRARVPDELLVEVPRGEVETVAVDPLAELQIHWDHLDAELPSQLARKVGGAVSDDGHHRRRSRSRIRSVRSRPHNIPEGPLAPAMSKTEQNGAFGGGFRAAVRSTGFRRLLIGQGVSSLGDWVATLAFISTAFLLTHGNQPAVAAVLVLRLVPPIFAAPVGGVVADRLHRRTIMVTCDLARAGLIAVVPFVIIGLLYAIAFIHESISLL